MCRCYIRYAVVRNLYTDAFYQNLLNVYLGQREFDYNGSDSNSDDDDDNTYQATTTSSSSSSSSGNDSCTRSNEMQENKSNQKKAIKNKDFLSRSGLQIWSIGRSPIVLPSVTPAPLTRAEAEAEADSQTQTLNYDLRLLDNSVDKECFEIGFDLSEEVLSSGSIRKEIKNDIEITEILKKNEAENLKNVAVQEAIEKSIELSRSKFDLLDYIETVVEMPE